MQSYFMCLYALNTLLTTLDNSQCIIQCVQSLLAARHSPSLLYLLHNSVTTISSSQ